MDATPLEQVVVELLAVNCTGELIVPPFAGLLTATLANAGAENMARINAEKWRVFIKVPSEF
jgi:hypothetical protein